jgi:hypothetical protein
MRVLFVPVSSPRGFGEYARAREIARAAQQRWPDAQLHFVLSAEAPYARECPFPATLLPGSATLHTPQVVALLRSFQPQLVIFDNAGRTAQLRAAQRLGSRVVYISARRRQRRKAFRWHWMRLIDEHWIAYPEFIAGRIGRLERLKLKFAGRPVVRYLDVILSRADAAQRGAILRRAGCGAGTFVLLVPGGGTGHPGAGDAVDEFLAAGRALAAAGVATVWVGPAEAGPGGAAGLPPNWHPLGPLPQDELAELMRSARLIIANGGSTLLQAIACGGACIAVPIAKDQAERTRRCVAAGVAAAATLDAAGIVQAANRLLQNEPQRAALAGRAGHLALADGIEVALRALDGLVEPAHDRAEA